MPLKKINNSACKIATLEIGDILFNISYPDSIAIAEPDDAYKSFMQKSRNHKAVINIKVILDLNEMPDTSSCEKIFESEPMSISINDGFIISLHKSALDEPLRMATVNEDFDNIVVYCSKYMQVRNYNDGAIQNPLHYPLDQILLTLYLSGRQGGLIHAGAVYIDNRAFLFPGKSGTGKSTLCRQFSKDKDFKLINDDRILIRGDNDRYMAYGTPWPGENGYAENIGLPLEGVFFINQSRDNWIRPIKRQDAFERLMPVISIPWYDSESVANYFTFCEELVGHIPMYELSFKTDYTISNVFKEFINTLDRR